MTNSTDLAISWDEWPERYRYNGWYPCTRRHTRESGYPERPMPRPLQPWTPAFVEATEMTRRSRLFDLYHSQESVSTLSWRACENQITPVFALTLSCTDASSPHHAECAIRITRRGTVICCLTAADEYSGSSSRRSPDSSLRESRLFSNGDAELAREVGTAAQWTPASRRSEGRTN
jgi:hypothetical protein